MGSQDNISRFFRGNTKHSLSSDLFFQPLSWEKEDITIEDENSDEEECEYKSDDEKQYTKKYKDKSLIIRTYGLTKEGISVCLEITDFQPYFLLKLPDNFSKSAIYTLQNQIKKFVSYQKKELLFSSVYMKKLYFFDNYKDHLFLKIHFKSESARWNTIKALSNEEKEYSTGFNIEYTKTKPIRLNGIKYQFDIYESNMDTIIRFIHISKIKPSGIIKVEKSKLNSTDIKAKCQIVYKTHWKNIIPVDEEWISPFRVSSFDIECTSKDGSFPQASRKDDKIIQIGTTTRVYGEKFCRIRHIVTIKKCENIDDIKHPSSDEYVVVESVDTEQELLHIWAKHIQNIDPDVIIGYNIFGFDWKYMFDRAKLLNCEKKITCIGRLHYRDCKLKDQRLSSNAMGHNILHYPIINGRVQIDILPVIRNNHNLKSYKLDNVADHFLNLRKNDLPPSQIFEKYKSGTPNDIKTIAEYCIQDCILVNDLFDKLDIFINSVGMSNVCLIPISLLFTRGQGIKVFSKIAEKCLERNTAFPLLLSLKYNESVIGYEGAIVLEPEPSFHKKPIAVGDFGSLYPSSMIENNISYETYIPDVDKEKYKDMEKSMSFRCNSVFIREHGNNPSKTCYFAENLKVPAKDENDKRTIPNLDGKGIIPSLLQDLLKARKAAKKQMNNEKDPFQKAVYNGKQLALKVTANSVYGYTGAKFSDLRFIDLAASTTATGREKILLAKKYAEENYKGTNVIYGDTDSIFLDLSGCEKLKTCYGEKLLEGTIELAQEMCDFITSKLRKPQVLEYEKTFWPFMILSMKRYAGNKYEFSPKEFSFTSMGLVTKRRDNAPVLKKIYKGIIDIIFNHETGNDAVKNAISFYRESVSNLLNGNVDLDDLVVSKTLKTGYKNPTQITHKVLAEKIKERDPGSAPVSNDRIPYIFIDSKEIKCHICKKRVNVDKCKCKICMHLYCSEHFKRHKKECIPRCRICWSTNKVTCCNNCGGGFCSKDKINHSCSNINEKILQGDLAETPCYIRENNIKVDYRYYYDHQIKNPVSQIFELFEETKKVDPLKDIIIKDNNRKNGMKNIRDFFT